MEREYSKKEIKTMEDFIEVVSTEREIERRYGEFPCIFMEGLGGDSYRNKNFYKEFKSENPELESKLREITSNLENPMGNAVYHKNDYFESYIQFKKLGVSDTDLGIRFPYKPEQK